MQAKLGKRYGNSLPNMLIVFGQLGPSRSPTIFTTP